MRPNGTNRRAFIAKSAAVAVVKSVAVLTAIPAANAGDMIDMIPSRCVRTVAEAPRPRLPVLKHVKGRMSTPSPGAAA